MLNYQRVHEKMKDGKVAAKVSIMFNPFWSGFCGSLWSSAGKVRFGKQTAGVLTSRNVEKCQSIWGRSNSNDRTGPWQLFLVSEKSWVTPETQQPAGGKTAVVPWVLGSAQPGGSGAKCIEAGRLKYPIINEQFDPGSQGWFRLVKPLKLCRFQGQQVNLPEGI